MKKKTQIKSQCGVLALLGMSGRTLIRNNNSNKKLILGTYTVCLSKLQGLVLYALKSVSGTFLYIGDGGSTSQGSTAKLLSPSFVATSDSGVCMSFWIMFSNPSVGFLSAMVSVVSYILTCLI